MVVVDDLDEGLHLAALGDAGFAHAAGDGRRVALDAGDEGVREGVRFAAVVLGLDDDDFLAGVAAAGDDGLYTAVWLEGVLGFGYCLRLGMTYHSADLEDCRYVSDGFDITPISYVHFIVVVGSSVWCVVARRALDVASSKFVQDFGSVSLGMPGRSEKP